MFEMLKLFLLFSYACGHFLRTNIMSILSSSMFIVQIYTFIRLDQKHVELARQASPFLRCFWSRLINLISKDTNIVFSIYRIEIIA